jgi:hypothetical protein
MPILSSFAQISRASRPERRAGCNVRPLGVIGCAG